MKYIVHNASAKSRRIFSCGGCYALAVLFKNLKSVGAEVYLSERAFNAPGLTPYEDKDFLENNEVDLNECIAIYPEVTFGNPIKAKYIARWLLHYPSYFNDAHESWNKDEDLFFSYQDWIAEKSKELGFRIDGHLNATHFNRDIFKDFGKARSGTCFIKRKGPLEGSKVDNLPEGAQDISTALRSANPVMVAETFNKYESFYTYDENTILSILAAMCGCNSIIASQSQKIEEYHGLRLDCWKYGVAYGINDLERAKNSRHLLEESLIAQEQAALETTKNFVAFTQEKYN